MSYTTRLIGLREILQDDRIILTDVGDPAPTPATGFTVLKIGTISNKDLYLEYKIYDGPIQ